MLKHTHSRAHMGPVNCGEIQSHSTLSVQHQYRVQDPTRGSNKAPKSATHQDGVSAIRGEIQSHSTIIKGPFGTQIILIVTITTSFKGPSGSNQLVAKFKATAPRGCSNLELYGTS